MVLKLFGLMALVGVIFLIYLGILWLCENVTIRKPDNKE
jgi:threonine/homoserine/homoserine lactone efflux protein